LGFPNETRRLGNRNHRRRSPLTTILLRRGTAAQWTAANPTLAQGEIGLETDTGKIKIGNGSAVWTALGYGPALEPMPFREPHAWSVPGDVTVGTLPGPEIAPAAGEQVAAVRVGCRILEGTAVKFSIYRNGSPMAGFSNLEATGTAQHATPAAVTLSEADQLTLEIEEISGSPRGLSVTLQLEHLGA
jgi:hypothetical protein